VSLGFGIIVGTIVLIFTLPAFAVLHLALFGHANMKGYQGLLKRLTGKLAM
jgi:hypothetical protein